MCVCLFTALLWVPTFVSTQEIYLLNYCNGTHVAFPYGGKNLGVMLGDLGCCFPLGTQVLCSSLLSLCQFGEGLLMETLVDSGGRVCTGLQYFRGAAYSSVSHFHCLVLWAHLAVGVQRILAIAVQERSSDWSHCLQMKQPLCKDSCLAWRPAAQAGAASGQSRSAQGQWHSLDFSESADRLAQPHLDIFLVMLAKSALESGQLSSTCCCISLSLSLSQIPACPWSA